MKTTRISRIKMQRRKRRILWLLAMCFALLFLFSGYKLISTLYMQQQERKSFDELASLISPDTTDGIPEAEQQPSAPQNADNLAQTSQSEAASSKEISEYQTLYEQNSDFAGWINITGTEINYPVMLTPDEPEYYLRRAFDGSDSRSGVPFIARNCTLSSNNILIYGHNMKNGTMFSDLTKYVDETFWEEHPIIRFNTLTNESEYKIVAVLKTQVYAVDEINVFRYYSYGGELDESAFVSYISNIKAESLYDTGVTPVYGDQLLTLSTCAYHTVNGRFVVVAKKAE